MKKVAFIVEEDFLTNGHFGVRNFFSTIKKALEDIGYLTDYVSFKEKNTGRITWYKLIPRYLKAPDDRYLEYRLNKKTKDNMGAGTGAITMSQVDELLNVDNAFERYAQCIGDKLAEENYDYAFITCPWVVGRDFRVEAGKVIGLMYDCIPNLYAITGRCGMPFAYSHAYGYGFYNENCDYVMADSKDAILQYEKFFGQGIKKARLDYFRPFVPWGIGRNNPQPLEKENAIILSAPFDLRKGLKEMPRFLNELKDIVDTLYIYGQPRCDINDFNKFFRELEIEHVVYYPYISSKGLTRLYEKCKFLYFPSYQEGLGLPILEAQVCGCRVIARDIAPMNELGLKGSIYFREYEEALNEVRRGMKGDFSYEELRQEARQAYLYDGIRKFMEELEA